jgi:murein DD-endopeptidase MepM/ murein hydrolase activator NlpD
MPAANGRPIRAPLSGLVEDVILWTLPSPNLGNQELWQVNVIVKHNDNYRYAFAFETFSANAADGQTQRNMIAVSKGQTIVQGDIIGSSYMPNPAVQVTVHFSFIRDGVSICPEPYFSDEARASILQLIHKNHPDWVFCF